MASGVVTLSHIEEAKIRGRGHATLQQELGREEPEENVWTSDDEEIDPYDLGRDILFYVTGEKRDPDEGENALILDAFEDAYFETWAEFLDA
jgi:hypothetical protein